MTRYTRVRLAPRGPFHFGGRGVGMEHSEVGLPADSLFSALCFTLAEAAGMSAVEALLARFPKTGAPASAPFRLTSLMPYAAGVHFLPYPMIGPPNVPGATELRKRKRFKAVQWVSTAVFRSLVRHQEPTDALDSADTPFVVHGGRVWLTRAEQASLSGFVGHHPETNQKEVPVLWRTGRRPRVTVDRVSSASAVYATGSTLFNTGPDGQTAGLYTVIEWLDADDALRDFIVQAFVRLGAAGIGGERSSGHGQFEPVFEDFEEWPIGVAAGRYFTTLSPYHPWPDETEVLDPGARYEIVLRRGWLSLAGFQNLRRASVRMLADGSVLHWPVGGEPLGDLADVTPDRLKPAGPRIYRYGLAFPVRIADAAMDLTPPAPLPSQGRGEATSPLLAGEGPGVRSGGAT